MDSSPSSRNYTFDQCINDFKSYYKDGFQEQLESPMPWIVMYIAAASAACALAMGADVVNGFRMKKLWFPSKYFSLNAFSLTVLAVAMKLLVDLTTKMMGVNDRLARISSLVLMSNAMSNFMVSLGCMENNEIMLNLAALGILVITIVGNVCIRLFKYGFYYGYYHLFDEVGSIGSILGMLLLLVILCSSSVMIPIARRYIESQYTQIHKRVSNDEKLNRNKITTNELRLVVRRYWMMAESGSPQFVVARSVTCVTSGLICMLMAPTLLVAYIRIRLWIEDDNLMQAESGPTSYKWSIDWILVIQSIGVVLGNIAPLLRWFNAAHFKSTMIGHTSFKDEFEVEAYWTQRLKRWRDGPLPLKARHHKLRKTLQDAKRLLLNFCIGVQILIVLASKLGVCLVNIAEKLADS